MNKKESLSRLLRTAEVFQEEGGRFEGQTWRNNLLDQFEEPETTGIVQRPEPPKSPLQFHHVMKMAPSGAALFFAGFLSGSGSEAIEKLGSISPNYWIVVSGIFCLACLGWLGNKNSHSWR